MQHTFPRGIADAVFLQPVHAPVVVLGGFRVPCRLWPGGGAGFHLFVGKDYPCLSKAVRYHGSQRTTVLAGFAHGLSV